MEELCLGWAPLGPPMPCSGGGRAVSSRSWGHCFGLEGQAPCWPQVSGAGPGQSLSGASVSPRLQSQDSLHCCESVQRLKPMHKCGGPPRAAPACTEQIFWERQTTTGWGYWDVGNQSQRLLHTEQAGASPTCSADGNISCRLLSAYCIPGPDPRTMYFTYKVTFSPQRGLPILQLSEVRAIGPRCKTSLTWDVRNSTRTGACFNQPPLQPASLPNTHLRVSLHPSQASHCLQDLAAQTNPSC